MLSAYSIAWQARWAPLGGIYYRNWKRDLPEWDVHWNKPITEDW